MNDLVNQSVKNIWIAVARTTAPLVAAYIITALSNIGVKLDEYSADLTLAVFGLIAFLYYVVVALAEKYVNPKLGWLLLVAKSPAYNKTVEDESVRLNKVLPEYQDQTDLRKG